MDERKTGEPMDELAAFILARVEEDQNLLRHYGSLPELAAERLRSAREVTQRLVAHVQGVDWAYEPAGDQDYMWKILELLALPWRDHPNYLPRWRI